MNNRKFLILGILIFFNLTISSQEERIEKVYQDCIYNSLSKKDSVALKRYLKGFEKHLIKLKFLKDSAANSYYDLFKSFSSSRKFPNKFEYSFIDSLNLIKSQKIFPSNVECSLKIRSHKDFKSYKSKIESAIPRDKTKIKESLNNYIKSLSVEDFELDYYKKHTFLIMDMLAWVYDDKKLPIPKKH